jgi:hypothetical protein
MILQSTLKKHLATIRVNSYCRDRVRLGLMDRRRISEGTARAYWRPVEEDYSKWQHSRLYIYMSMEALT